MSSHDTVASTGGARPAAAERGLGERLLLRALRGLALGRLELELPGGPALCIGKASGPEARLQVHRPARLVARLLARGGLGFAEGYMAGEWDSPDLAALLRLAAVNEAALGRASRGTGLSRALDRLRHLARRNHRRGSRRNIAYHYDLGNDFYQLWLDSGMAYSAARFEHPDEPLADAQARKNAAMLDLLDARPGDHVLEIGCGWGGLAVDAARRGLRVTGITLSTEQLAWARQRVAEAGVADRVELRLQDYRDVTGRFDHVMSVEMFEAVGREYWDTFFARVRALLAPGGRAALQVITIDESVFEAYAREADFIQRYIFPGGMLPSPERFRRHARAAGLEPLAEHRDGAGYAETLRRWHRSFDARTQELEALGYDARFRRLWRYYLAYCEAGFDIGRIDLMRTVLTHGGGASVNTHGQGLNPGAPAVGS
jgi:cyclopropane-fatty-acyl-phospholipid synthase